ncbi:MAG: hypothetical protein ACWA5R_10630 [bacterium]
MIHVFCDSEDVAALWLATELRKHGCSVTVSLPEELIVDSCISLELGDGTPRPYAELGSGISITPETSTAIIVRMSKFPLPALPNASDNDYVYATEEIRAALVGWFAAWECPVIGRPDPYTPWGDGASEDEWRIMALHSNIRITTDASQVNSFFDLLVTSSNVYTHDGQEPEPDVITAAQVLFRLQNDAIAVFRFRREDQGSAFEKLVPMPDFRIFGSLLPTILSKKGTA